MDEDGPANAVTRMKAVRRRAGRIGLLPAAALVLLPGCDPTAPPPGGSPTTECSFPTNQSTGLRVECTVSGGLANAKIDPVNAASDACGPATFLLFGQQINIPIEIVYGENRDDGPGRVRLGAEIRSASQSGRIAKAGGDDCMEKVGPEFDINSSFEGKHVALVDKSKTPACVFESRLRFDEYEQTIDVGLKVPIADATRAKVRAQVKRRMDLEMARTVNRVLKPRADISDRAFVRRAGRCENDYKPFTGD